MDLHFFVPLLAMFTLLVFIALAMRGAAKIEERREDDAKPPSSLAPDGEPHRQVD